MNLCLVNVNNFNTGSPNDNGELPIILNCVAGKIPFKRVMERNFARNNGFHENTTCLASWAELEEDEIYGKQFSFNCLSVVSKPMEIIEAAKQLGKAQIVGRSVEEPKEKNELVGEKEAVLT